MGEAIVPAIYDKTQLDQIIKIDTEEAFETSRRIEHFFLKKDCLIAQLNASGQVLRVDSTILDKAEVGEESPKKDQAYEERLKDIIEHSIQSSLTMNELNRVRFAVDEAPKREMLVRDIVTYWNGFAYELTPDHQRSIQIFCELLEKTCV